MRYREQLIRKLSQRQIGLLLGLRDISLHLLAPIDRLLLLVTGKAHLPPLTLRHYVGSESSAREFTVYLKLLAGLTPEQRLLEIGCGPGMVALELRDWFKGQYIGIDPSKKFIGWCVTNITSRHPNFQFEWVDLYNGAYNPQGHIRADSYEFSQKDCDFDIVLLKSVFTHMMPSEIRNYLREIKRLLKPSGKCIATFFLLDDLSNDSGIIAFPYVDPQGIYRYRIANKPEARIAYAERWIYFAIAESGLKVNRFYPGIWRGKEGGLSHQDIIVIEP